MHILVFKCHLLSKKSLSLSVSLWSCIKQLQAHHARHQFSLSFPGFTNVTHEPRQVSTRLDVLGSRDLQVFAKAKPRSNSTSRYLILFFDTTLYSRRQFSRTERISCPCPTKP